jgi:prefoldin subunit 5
MTTSVTSVQSEQLRQYEALVSETLLPLEKESKEAVDLIRHEIADLRALRSQLELLSTAPTPVKLLTDIGDGYKLHAKINDTSRICVRLATVAAGRTEEQSFYVEMPLNDAREFVSKKLTILEAREAAAIESLIRVSADTISAQIAIAALSNPASP